MTDYQAVLALIKAESTISSLLGTYTDKDGGATAELLAVVGTIPDGQMGLPAISIRNQINNGDYGISDTLIELHCYGANEPDSRALAQACYDFFRNSKGGSGTFSAEFNARILLTTPEEKITNTIVELRLNYR